MEESKTAASIRKSVNALMLFFFILLLSCHSIPVNVEEVLNKSDVNRKELEAVIRHYQSSGEGEKLKAAYFLIGNMDNKYTLTGEGVRKYDPLFGIFDSLNRNKIPVSTPLIQRKWDSLVNLKGAPSMSGTEIIPDYRVISAGYLIENIDLAFKQRDESAWLKKLPFEVFCESFLPYRTGHEPLESWRADYYQKYHAFRDSVGCDSALLLAKALHKAVPRARWSNVLTSFPFDVPFSKMKSGGWGSCPHVVSYDALSYRANNLPVYIDYAPLWGNFYRGHKWTVLILENGKHLPVERNYNLDPYNFDYANARVYRETFARQKVEHPDKKDVPEWLINDHRIDVTEEYTRTWDIKVKLIYRLHQKKSCALICTFNGTAWAPQDWGKIKEGNAFFKNMGSGVAYLAAYYDKGFIIPAADPFILQQNGTIKTLSPSAGKRADMRLTRKYPMHRWTKNYHNNMLNGKFQGANRKDFSDSTDLYTITTFPEKIESVKLTNPKKFRYIRYKSTERAKGDVGELAFFGGNKRYDTIKLTGKIIGFPEIPWTVGTPYQNAFDGKIETYFSTGTWGLSWAGLDLGEPKVITGVKYCPRSDTNFIVEGDRYELCYWDKDKWISMGEKRAKEPFLDYQGIPSGGLYILHNLSRGKEERIFTWEAGKQVFW